MYELFLRYEFSKITNRIGKKLFQSSRTYAVEGSFWPKILPSGKLGRSDTQEQRMLSPILTEESNYRPDRISDG
jgi:hypothetical protein